MTNCVNKDTPTTNEKHFFLYTYFINGTKIIFYFYLFIHYGLLRNMFFSFQLFLGTKEKRKIKFKKFFVLSCGRCLLKRHSVFFRPINFASIFFSPFFRLLFSISLLFSFHRFEKQNPNRTHICT